MHYAGTGTNSLLTRKSLVDFDIPIYPPSTPPRYLVKWDVYDCVQGAIEYSDHKIWLTGFSAYSKASLSVLGEVGQNNETAISLEHEGTSHSYVAIYIHQIAKLFPSVTREINTNTILMRKVGSMAQARSSNDPYPGLVPSLGTLIP